MPRVTTAFAAALALFLPIGRPLLVGLTPAVGIGAGLLSTQTAYAKSAQDWFDSGLEKIIVSGNLKGAIADFTKAIQINPNYAEAYFWRGDAKEQLKDYKGAIEDYTKAIEIKPNDADLYAYRGFAKSQLEDYKGAIDDYTKAIEIDPLDESNYSMRALIKENMGDLQGACSDWRKAADLGDSYAIEWVRNQC